MKLVLIITGPDGKVTELPVDDARLEIITQPGHRYQLATSEPGDPTGANPQRVATGPFSPRAVRVGDDLVLDQLPDGYPVQLSSFFANCGPQASCALDIDVPGGEIVTISPQSEPLAAFAEGGFLMYTASPVASAAIPAPPEAEPDFNWRPIAAVGGGVAVIAGVGSGGGSVASDSTAANAPEITGGTQTNSATPVFTGTADPNSSIRLTLQITGPTGTSTVGYATVVDRAGNWTIDTLTDTPTAGQFPQGGLQPGQNAAISVVATNAAGNISTVVNDTVVLDLTPPAQPTINTAGDLSASVSAALDGVPVVNAIEAADGVVIDGLSEAGSTVALSIIASNGFTVTEQVIAGADGSFSLTIAGSDLPANGEFTLNARATDLAGNQGPAFQTTVIVDQSLSDAVVGISAISDDRPPLVGEIANGGNTNDTTPTIAGSLVSALAADEQIELLRDGNIIGTADVVGANWSFTDNLNALAGGPQGTYEYVVRIADNAGNWGNGGAIGLNSAAVTVTVDITPPAQAISIDAVVDNNGVQPITVDRGGTLADPTPLIEVSISDVLAPGESLQLVRSQSGAISLVGQAVDADGSGELSFTFDDNLADGRSVVVYQAQVVDAAGLASLPSATYAIRILDPLDNLP
ncbi:MAG: Ig-like domain-containing protein [Burkholderiaceae bacterium]